MDEAVGEVSSEAVVIDRTDLNHETQEWYMGDRATVRARLYNTTDTSYIKFRP